MNEIASNIKQLRRERGLSQAAFAQALHVTRQTVSAWERGMSQPGLETLEQIAEVLEVDVGQVLYGGERAKKPRYRSVSFWPVLAVLPLWYCGINLIGLVLQGLFGGTGDALILLASQVFWGMTMVFCCCSLKDEIRNRDYYNRRESEEEAGERHGPD